MVLHHGGAPHADSVAHRIARTLGIRTFVHPSRDHADATRLAEWAKDAGVTILPAAPPLVRNKTMVRACSVLLSLPHQSEFLRSGTWSTVRYGRKLGRRIEICPPGGQAYVEEVL